MLRGAEITLQCLRAEGVELVFGYPGGAIMPLYDALDGSGIRMIPSFDQNLAVFAWSPDAKSLYAIPRGARDPEVKIYKVDPVTGKTEFWKSFGAGMGFDQVGPPNFSSDGAAYAYVYARLLSQAYVVTGLK